MSVTALGTPDTQILSTSVRTHLKWISEPCWDQTAGGLTTASSSQLRSGTLLPRRRIIHISGKNKGSRNIHRLTEDFRNDIRTLQFRMKSNITNKLLM